MKAVQQRGAAVIAARKLSSATSAAAAIKAHLRDWLGGAFVPPKIVSMAVLSPEDNPYGIPGGLLFSLPVQVDGSGSYSVASGFGDCTVASRPAIAATIAELQEEKAIAESIIETRKRKVAAAL